MRPALRPQTRRRHLAALACLLWCAGVELLPGVHLALHDRLTAHRHDAGDAPAGDELVARVYLDAHVHDGLVHRHGPGAPDPGPSRRGLHDPSHPSGPPHGEHSLAHRSLALLAAPPAVVTPLPVDHRPIAVTHAAAELVASAPPPERAARGPPG
jgi:hypothetical protein